MGLSEYLKNLSEDAKAKIKTAFNEVENPEKDEKFIDATLADGTVVMIEPGLEIGAMVSLEVEGEVVAAPDGAHELQDGTIIETEGGVITNVQPAEEMEETPEVPHSETPTEKEAREHKKEIVRQEVEKIFTKEDAQKLVSEAIEGLKEDFAKMLKEASKDNEIKELQEGFKVIVEGLGSMPSDTPVKTPKTPEKVDRVEQLRSKFSSLNKNK